LAFLILLLTTTSYEQFTKQTNREMRFKYENNFIQWKGTDVCMDFHCGCGEHNHYDGYFAYYVKCSGCGQVYQMDTKVKMKKVDDNDFNPLLGTLENK